MKSPTALAEPAVVTAASTASRGKPVVIATLVSGLAIVYTPTLIWLFGRWTMSVWHHAHGLFIPPLVAWLVTQELKRHRELPVTASAWGFAFVVPALALHVLDAGIQTQLLSALSLVMMLPGLSLLFLGWPRTKVIVFPLLFTAFALPIPLALTEQVHLVLRQVTTTLVSQMLSATGVSVFAQGTTVVLANATVEIADACSGFSTLYASMAFAFLLAYFSRSSKRKVLVLTLAAPIAVAANLLRMLMLLHLVAWRGPQILDTFIHPLSGMFTFALALPVLLWVGSDGPARPTRAVGRTAEGLEV